MLIKENTEYVVGTESKRSIRKLTGRRKDYSALQELGIKFACAGPGIAVYWMGTILYSSGWLVLVGVLLMISGGLGGGTYIVDTPATRRRYFARCVQENRVLTQEDVLFRMLMVPRLALMIEIAGKPGKQSWYEWDIDVFLAEVAPYRNRVFPERSQFLEAEWESVHGKIYDHPRLLSGGDVAGCRADLQQNVRDVLTALRQKRLAWLQQEQIDLGMTKRHNGTELAYQQAAVFARQ
jgi:hypothetical protein